MKKLREKKHLTMAHMRETEQKREAELGRPFSVISGTPKYNADYLENIIPTKWLPILEEREREEICQHQS